MGEQTICAPPTGAGIFIGNKGEIAMHKLRPGFAVFYVLAMLMLSAVVLRAAPQDASFVGSWAMTVTGGEDGDQGGGGGTRGGGGGNRGGAQSLTITQDGDKFKVSHKTRRGENAYDATVSGNTISWTEERPGRDGNTRKIQYKATLSGDTLKGTMGGGQFNREFTAKRSAQAN
jgi:hypothetical protein